MDWTYDSWPSGEPYSWGNAARGTSSWDSYDFHVDLGCGVGLKKGRIGVDQYGGPGVNIVMDLNTLELFGLPVRPGGDASVIVDSLPPGLPFEDSSIESIVSHHLLEHIGPGFIPLIDEIYRVLVPGGIFRAITPLFPSRSAIDDPTHVRLFTESTWEFCCGKPGEGGHWMESFSVPYTKARFEKVDQDVTALLPAHERWTEQDAREIRVALKANK